MTSNVAVSFRARLLNKARGVRLSLNCSSPATPVSGALAGSHQREIEERRLVAEVYTRMEDTGRVAGVLIVPFFPATLRPKRNNVAGRNSNSVATVPTVHCTDRFSLWSEREKFTG